MTDDWTISIKPLKPEVEKVAIEIAKQLVSEIKINANVALNRGYATGEYVSGWTYDKTQDSVIVYNDSKHRSLAHLLEYGHRTVSGTYVSPQPHIRPAYTKALIDYEKRLKDIKIELE